MIPRGQAIMMLLVLAVSLGLAKACTTTSSAGSPDAAAELPSQPPLVLAVAPAVSEEEGGVGVSIRGKNFHPWSRVRFGNFELSSVNVVSDREIRVVAPAGIGTVDVTVLNPGGHKHELAAAFTYQAPPEEPSEP